METPAVHLPTTLSVPALALLSCLSPAPSCLSSTVPSCPPSMVPRYLGTFHVVLGMTYDHIASILGWSVRYTAICCLLPPPPILAFYHQWNLFPEVLYILHDATRRSQGIKVSCPPFPKYHLVARHFALSVLFFFLSLLPPLICSPVETHIYVSVAGAMIEVVQLLMWHGSRDDDLRRENAIYEYCRVNLQGWPRHIGSVRTLDSTRYLPRYPR